MFELPAGKKVTLSVAFKDNDGNPAKVQGNPTWAVDNPNVIALTPSGDNLSCVVRRVGPLGVARVSMTADADLGEGVRDLVGIFDVETTAGDATAVELIVGEIEDDLAAETARIASGRPPTTAPTIRR